MPNGKKDIMSMSEDEINKLSDTEFNEAFPSASAPKKFYAEV
jgi:hypothetical protein